MDGYWTVADKHFTTRQQRMYLLSEPHGGHQPATSVEPATSEIMCNLIFAQNNRMWMFGEPQKRAAEWTAVSDRSVPPKGSWLFCSGATQSHCILPDTAHCSDTCINGIVAWNCRCLGAIVQNQVGLSFFFSFSLSYLTSVYSIYSVPYTHTHTHTFPILYPFVQSLLVSVST